MLSKINRIRKKKDFELIFKNSKSFKNNIFILRIAKNSLGLFRFGFVVSQKVSKKAVIRNKVKRRLSDIIKAELKNFSDIQSENGKDLVFITLPGIEKKEFSELKELVKKSLIIQKCLNQ